MNMSARQVMAGLVAFGALGGLGACAEQPKPVQVAEAPVANATTSVAPATGAPASSDPVAELRAKLAANAISDLQGAIQVAQGAGDKAALQCFTWELATAQSLVATVAAPPGFAFKTPLTNYAKLRAARLALASGNGLLSEFNLNCAALVNDEIGTLARVGIKVGGIVGTGGLGAPAMGMLGVLNSALPLPIGQ